MDRYWIEEKVRRLLSGQKMSSAGMMQSFAVTLERALEIIGDPSDIERIFLATEGPAVFKWLHYLPLYEQYFSRFRGTSFKMLEIGVFKGGSIQMWREYFGPDATICGIDIDPACADRVYPPNMVRIGSQDDPVFLAKVVEEMGGVDLILDDGSHIAKHQKASFDALFPLLSPGGLYACEDVQTAYWPKLYDGGYLRPGTAVEEAKMVIDDMHHWYHDRGFKTAARDMVTGVHFHDSIIFFDKAQQQHPAHITIGGVKA